MFNMAKAKTFSASEVAKMIEEDDSDEDYEPGNSDNSSEFDDSNDGDTESSSEEEMPSTVTGRGKAREGMATKRRIRRQVLGRGRGQGLARGENRGRGRGWNRGRHPMMRGPTIGVIARRGVRVRGGGMLNVSLGQHDDGIGVENSDDDIDNYPNNNAQDPPSDNNNNNDHNDDS